ncbi:MAG: DPP IV N-terminal domain-containing protein, partial [Gemmataceae bacterium]
MGTICRATLGVIVLAWLVPPASSQDRLKTMPGYKRYADMLRKTPRAFTSGALSVRWQDDGKSFEYTRSGKRYRYDVTTRKATIVPRKKTKAPKGKRPSRPTRSYVPRGRQAKFAVSPDTRWRAFYKDANLWLRPEKGEGKAIPITTKGNATKRLKFGTASWVYGEELYQKTAMWWSPDSKKIAFYRIDQSKVRDSYLTLNQRQFRNTLSVEAYPKPGEPNPILDIFVYDLDTKKTIQLDVRNGKPFTDDVVGHYVYAVKWTPDGKELLFHRTNRWQNILEICAANPKSGKCRVVVREEWLPSWTENRPQLRFLEDGKKFILASDRTGWRNYYLYDLSGKLKCPITRHKFDVSRITRIDEKNGFLYYLARSGDNHMKLQLHRVKLDGTEDQRLTHPAYNHRVTISPDGKSIVDVAETHNHPPETKLLDATGKVLDVIATSDVTRFEQLGLNKTELFQFTAADGKTVLHGILHKPSQFDPKKKYPLLVGVYAGPETNAARERFLTPSPLTDLGFLVARFDSRSVGGRGKRVVDAIYQ